MTPPVFSVSKDANELPHSPPPHRPSVRSSGPRVVKSIASSSRRLHRIAAAARPPPPRAAPRTANPNGSSRQQTRSLVNMSQRGRSRMGAGKKGSEARPSATTTTSRTPLPTGAMAPVRSAANVRGRAMPSDRGKRAERGVGEGRGSHRRGAAACTPCRYRARWQGGPGGGGGEDGGKGEQVVRRRRSGGSVDGSAASAAAAAVAMAAATRRWRRRQSGGGRGLGGQRRRWLVAESETSSPPPSRRLPHPRTRGAGDGGERRHHRGRGTREVVSPMGRGEGGVPGRLAVCGRPECVRPG